MNKSFISWSSGKDAAFSLLKLKEVNRLPHLLVTNINANRNRVSMHGVRQELLEMQAQKLNIPLKVIPLDENINMADYINITHRHFNTLYQQAYKTCYYGDIFLEDLKKFRIKEMKKANIEAEFPLWKKNTKDLAVEIINSGIKAIVTAVSSEKLGKDFVGKDFNMDFLKALPNEVDWCGENGEFHTFVYDHPLFSSPINIEKGEIIFKSFKPCSNKDDENFNKTKGNNEAWETGFWYIDIFKK